jgi:hypothetical protein
MNEHDRAELDRLRTDRGQLVAALQDAGGRIDGDKVGCPFHDDAKASGGIHESDGAWFYTCHACAWNGGKRSGDLVDVTRRARDLDFRGALAALGVNGNARNRGGTPAACHATAPDGAADRGKRATGQERALDAKFDAGELAAECAARLQVDPAALGKLWATRAVDVDTARRFGVGLSIEGGYWTFPVSDGGRVVAVKHHRADAGTEPKCFWEPRGIDSRRLWPVGLDCPGPVWLCPGELKALCLIAAGRSAAGITGGETAELPDGLVDLLAGRSVAVVGDDDEAGRKWTRAALAKLGDGGIDARGVDLGLSKADGVKDIGDWILTRVQDGKEPTEIAAELDAAYQAADPWARFTLAGVWNDKATWAPVYHVPTGLRELDAGLNGGLRVGGVTLFVGKSGRAKTQTVTQLALNAARAGVPVGFVSLEMSRRDVGHLIAANLADVPRAWLGDGTLHGAPAERLQRVLQDSARLPPAILDDGFWTGALTRSKLAGIVADGRKRFGWRLVVLDYLGLLANEPTDGSEYTADLENSAALKRLARVQDVALVVVAALRKYGRKDDAPTCLDDVLGAGRIVYDAYNVFDVDCQQSPCADGTKPSGLVRLRPLKTRYAGLTAAGGELQFRWWPGIGRICDLDREPIFDRPETRQAERQAPDVGCAK